VARERHLVVSIVVVVNSGSCQGKAQGVNQREAICNTKANGPTRQQLVIGN
jgi:hypothetical protein